MLCKTVSQFVTSLKTKKSDSCKIPAADLRNKGCGPGALVSGMVWLTSAITKNYAGVPTGFAALFFGGMLIFPAANLIVTTCCRRQPESPENPGKWTVLETVFPMIGGLFSAWLILPYRSEFVSLIVAMSVGAHYFGFRTAYGDWTYWLLGGIMCSIGFASILWAIPPARLRYVCHRSCGNHVWLMVPVC